MYKLQFTKTNCDKLYHYLLSVDNDFGVPLSEKANLRLLSEKLLKDGFVLAKLENRRIVSVLCFYANDLINRIAYISIMSSKEIVRGKGYARQLITECIDICRERGMAKIQCDSINPIAIGLYKSVGFIQYKQEKYKSFCKEYLVLTL